MIIMVLVIIIRTVGSRVGDNSLLYGEGDLCSEKGDDGKGRTPVTRPMTVCLQNLYLLPFLVVGEWVPSRVPDTLKSPSSPNDSETGEEGKDGETDFR